MNLLQRLARAGEARRLARLLHLTPTLRHCYYLWARPPGGVLDIEVKGLKAGFYVPTYWDLCHLEPSGGYRGEQHTLEKWVSALYPADVVYDVGSNVGLYTVFSAKAVGERGQVIAFEPESRHYSRLGRNLKLNGLTNVRAFRKALGDTSGTAKLYLGQEDSGCSSVLARPDTKEKSYQVVEIAEGDRLVEAESLPLPQAVKVDVEGYEYAVLQGLRCTLAQPVCELVCCEIHPHLLPAGTKPEHVTDLLRALGFTQMEIYARGRDFHALAHKPNAPKVD